MKLVLEDDGDKSMEISSIIIEFDIASYSYKRVSPRDFRIDYSEDNKLYWIHSDLEDKETFDMLTQKLDLPEEVIELCQEDEGVPKLIDIEGSIALHVQCLQSLKLDKENNVLFNNLILHLTNKFCFTASKGTIPAVLEFLENSKKAVRYAKTPCFIFFLILDNIINDYAKILFEFELVADKMDLRVRARHKNIYDKVMDVKKQLMKVKRYMILIREILVRLSGRNIIVISEECRLSLFNLSNHSHILVHEIDSIRDMLNGLLDQIANTLMQKMSESMKVLTAFAAIFLPMTVITGIYGMNFRWMPELQWKYGYFWAISLILCSGVALLIIFKKRKWF